MDLRRPRAYFVQSEEMFNGQTYTRFLSSLAQRYRHQEVFLVQDNAPYHVGPEVQAWLEYYGHRFHLVSLPKYSPDLNAEERIWHHVRIKATHNRYFPTKQEFVSTLGGALTDIERHPEQIAGYLDSVPAARILGGALDIRSFKTHQICPRWVNRVVMLGVL